MEDRTKEIENLPDDLREAVEQMERGRKRLDAETPAMTAEEFSGAIDDLYGGSKAEAARDLGISDARVIRRYSLGERKIPPGLAREIRSFRALKVKTDKEPDYRSVIEQMQKQGEQGPLSPALVATAILGCAAANARRQGVDVEWLFGNREESDELFL